MRINPIFSYAKTTPKISVSSNLKFNYQNYDTINFGAKKKDKKEKVGNYYKKDIVKRLTKKGCAVSIVDSIFSNGRKKEHLAKFIEEYENGTITFSRPPKEREICFAIDNDFSNEKLQQLISYQDNKKENEVFLSRGLKTKEALAAIEVGATIEQIQRALTLSDKTKDGKNYLSVPLTFKEGLFVAQNNLDDTQADIYYDLRKNNIYNALSFVTKKDKYERFTYLTTKPELTRPLTRYEAARVMDGEFDDVQIQRFIDIQKGNGEENSPDKIQGLDSKDAFVVVRNNFDNIQGYYYLKLKDENLGYEFTRVIQDEEKFNKFLILTGYRKDEEAELPRILEPSEAMSVLRAEFDYSQIKKYIKLKNDGLSDYIAVDLIKDFSEFEGIEDIEQLNREQKRDLLRKIMSNNQRLFNPKRKKEDYPLVPRNNEEYCTILPKLAQSIGINIEPITEEEKQTCFNGLTNLIEEIKTTNLDKKPKLKSLESVLVGLEEFRKTIRTEADNKTLRVLQNVVMDDEFEKLSECDKKILTIATILHSINKKKNGEIDSIESAFDAFYIIQKLNLSEDEQLKIYEIIKSQDWQERLENSTKENFNRTAQDIAFETRHTNTFKMTKILSKGKVESKKEAVSLNEMSNVVEKYLKELQKTQIYLPQTKIPKANEVKGGEIKEADGIRNIVLDMDKLSDDLSLYGFDEGTTKDNLTALVHGFEKAEELGNFSTFSIIDTEAILSSSLMNLKEHKVFRKQGIILAVHSSDIHAGYYKDFGSGTKKDIERIKCEYIFAGERENKDKYYYYYRNHKEHRTYISDLIKQKLNLSDEEYIELIKEIQSKKAITDVQKVNPKAANAIQEAFDEMELGKRRFDREYNEMLISRPKIQGVFSYGQSFEEIPLFLRKYANENNLPILMFGN